MSIDSTLARQMTSEEEFSPENPSLSGRLPWIVGFVSFAVYLFTLSHSVSANNVAVVAKLSGWTWQAELSGPLYFLITYPIRWLPVRLIPHGLNLLSAILASLTLAMLARSVMLLPHDRTQAQRDRERSPFALLTIKHA